MALITSAECHDLFEDMGCIVRLYNLYKITWPAAIVAETALEYAEFGADNSQIAFLDSLVAQDEKAARTLEKLALQEKLLCDNYIRNKVKTDIDSVSTSVKDILIDLDRAMQSADAVPQTIAACGLTTTGLLDDANVATWAIPVSITATRYFPTCRIILECVNVDTLDSELWSVKCTDTTKKFNTQATTAVAYDGDDNDYDLEFTIPVSVAGTPTIGDRLFIDIVNDDVGLWDKFFRDVYGVVLNGTAGAETILDSLAEAP